MTYEAVPGGDGEVWRQLRVREEVDGEKIPNLALVGARFARVEAVFGGEQTAARGVGGEDPATDKGLELTGPPKAQVELAGARQGQIFHVV